MAAKAFLAIDMGASSGRHLAGLLDRGKLTLHEVHRFENGPVTVAGRMYWDVLGQWSHIQNGLRLAGREYGASIASVGIDTWGVDFGLLGKGDELVGQSYNYRDARTQGMMQRAFGMVSREEIFAETGLQFMEINTLYQLLAMNVTHSPLLQVAESLLLMPDLFHWMLTGVKANELTDASTTQLFNPRTQAWSSKLIEKFQLPASIFGPIVQPGTSLGSLLPSVAAETQLGRGVHVVLPGTHDTASAVVAVPADGTGGSQPDWCYISSGTWSLMGVEVDQPVIDETCRRLNFTNEGGVQQTTRLLKNIAGLWLVQECRRIWDQQGQTYSWEELVGMAEQAPPLLSVINPDDPTLVAPDNMPEQIAKLCRQSQQPVPADAGAMVRCALESLALKYRQVLGWLEELTGGEIRTVHIVGGGTQNRLLCQMAADACQRTVVAGPAEATAIGNVAVQAMAAGEVASIAEARQLVRNSFPVEIYEPRNTQAWDDAQERFTRLSPEPA